MVISVPAIDRQRYYSVQLCDGNTYNYGYIGTRATGTDAGDYMVAGPGWNGATPPGIKQIFRSGTQHLDRDLPDAAFWPLGHRQRQEGAGRLPRAAAVCLPEAARTARRAG